MKSDEMEKRLPTLDELAKKVRRLEDIEAIKTLMNRYVNSLVFTAWDELVDCFTDDARISIGISGERRGKAAIARLFKQEIGTRHIGKEHVLAVHPVITVEGNKASGRWLLYFMFTEATHTTPDTWTQGPYEVEFERKDARWKISYLKWTQRVGPKPARLYEIYDVKDAKTSGKS